MMTVINHCSSLSSSLAKNNNNDISTNVEVESEIGLPLSAICQELPVVKQRKSTVESWH